MKAACRRSSRWCHVAGARGAAAAGVQWALRPSLPYRHSNCSGGAACFRSSSNCCHSRSSYSNGFSSLERTRADLTQQQLLLLQAGFAKLMHCSSCYRTSFFRGCLLGHALRTRMGDASGGQRTAAVLCYLHGTVLCRHTGCQAVALCWLVPACMNRTLACGGACSPLLVCECWIQFVCVCVLAGSVQCAGGVCGNLWCGCRVLGCGCGISVCCCGSPWTSVCHSWC